MIQDLLKERIFILDGGLGTMIPRYGLTEDDYCGVRFTGNRIPLTGNYDLLSITCPDVIRDIHGQYLDAGADIISTNTLNSNAVSMEEYGMQSFVREINLAAAKIACGLADEYMGTHPDRTVFVAGSIGPTNKSASMSPDMNDPAFRAVSYMDLYHSYYEQSSALFDGGVDILLFETTFDTLNVKAGLDAAVQMMSDKGRELPIMLSLTLSGKGGRTFSGQTLPAFLASIQHIPLISIGLNCSFGASAMKPYLKELAGMAPYFISAHPNAGLPNQFGQYDETPENMALQIKEFVDDGIVNIIGGCCGTTPMHIARYPALIKGAKPHQPVAKTNVLWLSGLDLLEIKPENQLINIGERCNVAGSRRFLHLIKEKKTDDALAIARKQVEAGAQIIDINMDDGMLNAVQEMKTFLNLLASEPEIARVPVMIDSSKWEVIEQGLMCVQGKSIVNSISLKEGEDEFFRQAKRIRRLGAAVIVMAFDEKGQAGTYQRKIEVCERAYRFLTEQIGFPPQDIIFDPNVLAIATGIQEHNGYGLDFIRAVSWIKQHLPGAKVSGGVSNLSFSFRGNDYVREAMHAVFLYHAIRAGLDMCIANISSSVIYEDIEPSFRNLLEDVVLDRRPEATEELIEQAQRFTQYERSSVKKSNNLSLSVRKELRITNEKIQDSWRELSVEKRLEYALEKGINDYLEADLSEAVLQCDRAVQIVDGPLMNGLKRVGDLFGKGKIFLPQVLKTARTMKKAVEILQPHFEREQSESGVTSAGKIVIATVKGDVHDIGKNIVSIVLACNNYEVIDLGVMTPAETIIESVVREKPDLLCLSGLITPSLEEMITVVKAMQNVGQQIPILIGGATTSKIHTVLKISPHYDYPVIHVTDASQSPLVASRLLNDSTSAQYIDDLKKEYAQMRLSAQPQSAMMVSLTEARKNKPAIDWISYRPVVPAKKGVHDLLIHLTDIIPYINWTYFFTAWGLSGQYDSLSQIQHYGGDGGNRENRGNRGKTAYSMLNCFPSESQTLTYHTIDKSQYSIWINQWPESAKTKAKEAVKLYGDAQVLLQQLAEKSHCMCRARYGFFEAVSDGDDIIIGKERIPTLRQQLFNENKVYRSLSDYIMPVSEGRTDYIGIFMTTAGYVPDGFRESAEKAKDSYRQLLIQSLADRLAEASSEYLHHLVRKELWGYSADESYAITELYKGKYKGIRPAIGYPSLPDQGVIFTLDKLLQFDKAGVYLTVNGAMMPKATIAGLYIAHPLARYFMVGPVSDEQLQNYTSRRNEPLDVIRKFLGKLIE